MGSQPEERWQRRRASAWSLRAAIVGGPVVGSIIAMAVLSRVIPAPARHSGTPVRIGWWALILVGSLVAMWLTDRATRRLAPLAALLDMAVLFPGHAPTRFRVARRAGDLRQLEEVAQRPSSDIRRDGLAEAAEQILALVGALRAHDRHTRGHSERVRVYSDLIAAELRLPPAAVDRLRWAALLHDIGKMRVPVATLNKPAKLSTREWETIRQHPVAGAELASALLPWLGEWGRAIAEHHERFNGTGYPFGLSGREISLAGRIVAVADSFEVMTASRVYKRAMTRSTALEELVRFSGSQFDPEVVRAFLAVSAPKLRWAMGPTSWLVGTPLLGSAPSLTAAGVAAQAAVGVSTVAVASIAGLAGPAVAAAGQSPTALPTASLSTANVAAPAPGPAAKPRTAAGNAKSAPKSVIGHAPEEPVGASTAPAGRGGVGPNPAQASSVPAVQPTPPSATTAASPTPTPTKLPSKTAPPARPAPPSPSAPPVKAPPKPPKPKASPPPPPPPPPPAPTKSGKSKKGPGPDGKPAGSKSGKS